MSDYNFNNLSDLLKSGISAEEIAKSFTKNLNDAIDAMKPNKFQEQCCKLAEAWHDTLNEYCAMNGEDIKVYEDFYVTGNDLEKVIPSALRMLRLTHDYLDALVSLNDAPVQKNTEPRGCQCKKDPEDMPDEDFDALMRVFLDSIGAN